MHLFLSLTVTTKPYTGATLGLDFILQNHYIGKSLVYGSLSLTCSVHVHLHYVCQYESVQRHDMSV